MGSGQYLRFGTKETTESQRRVDIRFLKKQGWLIPNTVGTLSWTSRGKPSGNINYHIGSNHMVLDYNIQINGGDWQPIEQTVFFNWTPCNFGGRRQWFLCPGCGRRVAVIYGAGRLFLCRHCHRLTYGSQQETRPFRLLRRSRKIKERLGVDHPMDWPTVKPKGMHRRTFNELRIQALRYEDLGWTSAAMALGIPTDRLF